MALKWTDTAIKAKKLSIYPMDALTSSAVWGPLFTEGLKEFDAIAAKVKLGISFEVTKTPPAKEDIGGADVQVGISGGEHEYYAFGKEKGKLPPGLSTNAITHQFQYQGRGVPQKRLAKAFIFLPASPWVINQTSGEKRVPGRGILLYVFLHELIHALGLETGDPGHNSSSDPDVFLSYVSQSVGDMADGEKGQPGDRMHAVQLNKYMPPFRISPATAKQIKAIWK